MDENPGLTLHFVCRPGSAPVNHPPTKAQTVRLQPAKKVLLKTLWLRFIEYMKMILDKIENNEMVLDMELCVSRHAFDYAAWVQNWVSTGLEPTH